MMRQNKTVYDEQDRSHIRTWIESVTNMRFKNADSFYDTLRDGVILCKYDMTKYFVDLTPSLRLVMSVTECNGVYHKNPDGQEFKERANINTFMKKCEEMGCKCSWSWRSLQSDAQVNAILHTLVLVAKKSETLNFKGPYLSNVTLLMSVPTSNVPLSSSIHSKVPTQNQGHMSNVIDSRKTNHINQESQSIPKFIPENKFSNASTTESSSRKSSFINPGLHVRKFSHVQPEIPCRNSTLFHQGPQTPPKIIRKKKDTDNDKQKPQSEEKNEKLLLQVEQLIKERDLVIKKENEMKKDNFNLQKKITERDSIIEMHKKEIQELKMINNTLVYEIEVQKKDYDSKKAEFEDGFSCQICMDRRNDIVLIPCGHTLCKDCSFEMRNCPFCSIPVKNKNTLYL